MLRRTMTVLAATLLAFTMIAAPALAHHLVVDPPGGGHGPDDAWVGGPPLPGNANGRGLADGPPTDPEHGDFTPLFKLPAGHVKGLNTACMTLRHHGNSAVDIFGPFPETCHHGP